MFCSGREGKEAYFPFSSSHMTPQTHIQVASLKVILRFSSGLACYSRAIAHVVVKLLPRAPGTVLASDPNSNPHELGLSLLYMLVGHKSVPIARGYTPLNSVQAHCSTNRTAIAPSPRLGGHVDSKPAHNYPRKPSHLYPPLVSSRLVSSPAAPSFPPRLRAQSKAFPLNG